MDIIPAIDLIDGKCVRLIQGNYNKKIDYNDDPVAQAEIFASKGAKKLHVVDLEGAKTGKSVNADVIGKISAVAGLEVQVGGGIRDEQTIQQFLDLGISKVIIGTKAVEDFQWFAKVTETFKGHVILGLDGKGANVATHGWTKSDSRTLLEFAIEASKLPIEAIIYTDISKDGMMIGPNVEKTRRIADAVTVPVIASGGVNTIEDIEQLSIFSCISGVIVGRSLYEGSLDLADAIAVGTRDA